ncbi:hypothetical protein ACFTAO_01590 [Paenibacillus rhizoplanae]
MKNTQLILQAIQYIESNLKQPLSVLTLSRETGYSLFHFIRLFQGGYRTHTGRLYCTTENFRGGPGYSKQTRADFSRDLTGLCL